MNKDLLPKDFDWKMYIKLNPDLYKIEKKTEAINHYLKCGIKEKRMYKSIVPDCFNWKMYLDLNPDIEDIYTKEDAEIHYNIIGFKENRPYQNLLPFDFDWQIYLDLNPDLYYINTDVEAIAHYLKIGAKEKRLYKHILPKDFNWKMYIDLNEDLKHITTRENAEKHYLKIGINKDRQFKRQLPKDFNWVIYLEINKDLYYINNEEKAIIHYLQHGIKEGKKYKNELPEDFDWEKYLNFNVDLSYLKTKENAIAHYLQHGIKEERIYKNILPEDFDWEVYLALNTDLCYITVKEEAIMHYLKHGIKEERKYKQILPFDFDWEIYLDLNPDLIDITNKEDAEKHYLKLGFKTNRKYKNNLPEDFDWEIYLDLNPDLDININNKDKAIANYLKYGIKEARKYKRVLPVDFNWEIYLDLNSDLFDINNKEDAEKHYLKYGIKEERKYKRELPFDFDWEIYLDLNPDLIDITNKEDAEKHYLKYSIDNGIGNGINNGINNGIDNCINNGINNGIDNGINNGIDNGINNGIDNGINNGIDNNIKYKYELPDEFDWKIYLDLNPDLDTIISRKDAEKHFLTYGINTNREYKNVLPHDFDWNIYLSCNQDLINITNKENAEKHYLKYGIREARKYKIELPYDFDWEIYLEVNPHLVDITNKEDAEKHYLKHGYKRLYKDSEIDISNIEIVDYNNFNWKSYIFLNQELINFGINDHGSAYNHYVHVGIKEKRKYYEINNLNFDWKLYLFYNNDLLKLGLDNQEKVYNHWSNLGYKQDCNYRKQNIFINNNILYNYYDKLENFVEIYNVTKDEILNNKKIEFRYFCFKYLEYIRTFKLHDIKKQSNYEAVLIEFRCFHHIEFIIRNNILKLGEEWAFTIICGNLNYNFVVDIVKNISENIKVIKVDYDNLSQSTYSKFLASKYFWNLFNGKKILIYQEDSILFKSNIDDFLKWDYIGAPWPNNQDDNSLGVGNGGLSLRTKKCMLDVIKKIDISNTKFNISTIEYMKKTGQTVGPEDVYFTLNMINNNIGKIPNREIASYFSTELIYNENSLGGHNFWLSTDAWKDSLYKHVLYCNINLFNICAISTPYGLKMGGGENYILNIAKYFINYKNCIIYLFVNEDDNIIENTIKRILNYNYTNYFIVFDYCQISKYKGKVDYHVDMSNSKFPSILGCAKNINKNFYHCQFPFDINKKTNDRNIISFKNIIVNSDFTRDKYKNATSDSITRYKNKIHILYPNCFNNFEKNNIIKKTKNTFVMIGRIFDYNPDANNKGFDIALKYFEKLSLQNINNFHVYIIGEVYSQKMLKKLKSFKIKNISFYNNITNEEKNKILSESEYIINMVGINRDIEKECYAYEHFGMSIIEGIYYKCVPISINGGYVSYYIKEKDSLFNNEEEFYSILENIVVHNKKIYYNQEYYNTILQKYNQDSFNLNMNSILI